MNLNSKVINRIVFEFSVIERQASPHIRNCDTPWGFFPLFLRISERNIKDPQSQVLGLSDLISLVWYQLIRMLF